ncbi:MAG TPA: queuosine salvage family protein, partial [Phycisphaerae bacterium]|nr:queuosine salvage family protein [Phycisphaerae bacterium]
FRDVARYKGRPVYFMKRAQICALDLAMAFQTHDHPPLAGLEELTAFADYRVPQALRHLGILTLTNELAQKIDSDQEIEAESEAEIELRAATIHAVERMKAALAGSRSAFSGGGKVPAWQIDWYLWALSHRPEIQEKHHRTRTVYY